MNPIEKIRLKMDMVAVTMTDMLAFFHYCSGNQASDATNAPSLSGLKVFYGFLMEHAHTLSWFLQKLRCLSSCLSPWINPYYILDTH